MRMTKDYKNRRPPVEDSHIDIDARMRGEYNKPIIYLQPWFNIVILHQFSRSMDPRYSAWPAVFHASYYWFRLHLFHSRTACRRNCTPTFACRRTAVPLPSAERPAAYCRSSWAGHLWLLCHWGSDDAGPLADIVNHPPTDVVDGCRDPPTDAVGGCPLRCGSAWV